MIRLLWSKFMFFNNWNQCLPKVGHFVCMNILGLDRLPGVMLGLLELLLQARLRLHDPGLELDQLKISYIWWIDEIVYCTYPLKENFQLFLSIHIPMALNWIMLIIEESVTSEAWVIIQFFRSIKEFFKRDIALLGQPVLNVTKK